MRAEILAIGSELLTPLRSDTNALHLTARFLEAGVEVGARVTVADDFGLLESAFRVALQRADVVVSTGGLGPTEDDLTRECAAAALGRALVRDEGYVTRLRERFARLGRVMAPVNEKQGDVIEGGRLIFNPRGTAPAQVVEADGRLLVLLPGPPHEMGPLFDEHVLPLVRERAAGRVLRTRVLRIAGLGESDVEQLVAPIYKTFDNPRTTILGAAGQVELHLTAEARSSAEADERIEALAAPIRAALPGRVFSEDGRELHEVVAGLLIERGLTLSLAESCTGGMVAARLTDVPGASAFLERGYVVYSNRAKCEELGVDAALIERHGAVSEEVARAMAEGARRASGSDVGAALTGIAGPGGGTPDKPLGLVYLAVCDATGTRVRRAHFPGERWRVREQALKALLELLRRGLLALQS